jgi:riboflavin-specific deaminase-like protein
LGTSAGKLPVEDWLSSASEKQQKSSRPLVTLSYAQSLDGSITIRRGSSQALSGAASRSLTHRLRAAHDAILVGIGTVLADDPRLTVRYASGKDPQPVVLDARLRFPPEANLLRHTLPPWIAISEHLDPHKTYALEAAGARLLRMPETTDGEIDLDRLLEHLGEMGIRRLMVEGGARVIASFLGKRLIDFAIITITPVFIGGLHAVESLLDDHPNASFPRLESPSTMMCGEDIIVWGSLNKV